MLYSIFFFFFKQKTAYEMRISDWSSDVCSSDLDQAGENEVDRAGRHRMDHRRRDGDEQYLEQRGAHDDLRPHAEEIAHRRNHDEAAADAEQHRPHPDPDAAQQLRTPRDIKARATDTPAPRQIGHHTMVAPRQETGQR